MDYKHWCQSLSPDEFELWEVETLMVCVTGYDPDDHIHIFSDHYNSFREFISGSFTWRNTKQGHEYWRIIANRQEQEDGL